MIREKRQHARTLLDKPCSVEQAGAPALAATLHDLSVGGAFIATAQVVPFGTEVTLVFTAEGQATPLRLPGVVRWAQSDGFGMQFGLLGARETFAITQLAKKPA
jgi:type IV pilus assembly protein PilZ